MTLLKRLLPGLALLALTATFAGALSSYPSALNRLEPEATLGQNERPVTPPAASPQARPERVVLVVLDGLRLDTSRTLPYLNGLRLKGVDAIAEAPLPSFSKPGYAAMGAGVTPWRSGVRTNAHSEPIPVDTVFARARAAGLHLVGAANHPYWPELFKDQFVRWWWVPPTSSSAEVDRAARDILNERGALTVLHFVDIDAAGHAEGVSGAYTRAATSLDARLKQLLAPLDLTRDLILVTSDHGHVQRGGHGGPEPEVVQVPLIMAGRGVTPGTHAEVGSLARLAPTLSVVLSVEYPRALSSEPLDSLLDPEVFGDAYLKARRQEWIAHRASYERMWLHRTLEKWTTEGWNGERIGNDVSKATEVADDADLSDLIAARDRTLLEIERDRRVGRTPLVALLLVGLLLVLSVGLLFGYRLLPLLTLPTFGGALTGGLLALDVPLSFSAVSSREAFLITVGVTALLAALLHLASLEALLRTTRAPHRREARRFHAAFAALCYLTVIPLVWLLAGYHQDAPLPSPSVMFAPMWLGPAAIVFATLAALLWCADALRKPTASRHAQESGRRSETLSPPTAH
ncbi:MAG: hypothetical protein CMH57_10435 [Myxococcales bacterium]|nr:hypothetical protein [Myxococcales bacterium]